MSLQNPEVGGLPERRKRCRCDVGWLKLSPKKRHTLECPRCKKRHRPKKILPVLIVPVQESLIPGIMKVSQMQLGELFLHEFAIIAPNNIGFCALYKDRVVGFCIGRILPSKDFIVQHSSIAQLVSPDIFESTERIGFLDDLAVDPSFEGQGIGAKLVRSVVAQIDESDVSISFLTGWKSPKGLHISGIAHALGFKAIREIKDFYKDLSLQHGYRCPACGKPPCRCSAVVMIRTKEPFKPAE